MHATLMKMISWLFTIFYLHSITLYANYVAAHDTLFPNQVLRYDETLVSSNQRFEMGFFGSARQHRRYLGLWFKNMESAVVWVGNRLNPLGHGAMLVLTKAGCIFLQDDRGKRVWVYRPKQVVARPVLQLLDSGNLVFGDYSNLSAGEYLWQSFDHPVDTLLPGMKLGWDQKTGLNRYLTSWKTSTDPAPGEYLFRLDSGDSGQSHQLVLEKKEQRDSRWGPWDGQKFSGIDDLEDDQVLRPILYSNTDALYFTFEAKDDWSLKLSLSREGKIQFLKCKNATKGWVSVKTLNKDICDQYRTCGPNGVCSVEDPSCHCPDDFTAVSPDDWNKRDFTEGCRRTTPLSYSYKDVFVKYTGLKLPDNATYWGKLFSKECEEKCLNESLCMAYTNIIINGNGSECLVWLGDLLDMRHTQKAENDVNIRMAHGKLEELDFHGEGKSRSKWVVFVCLTSVVIELLLLYIHNQLRRQAMRTRLLDEPEIDQPRNSLEDRLQGVDVTAFDFSALAAATNNFSLSNKIGHGGFGNVYKGVLNTGEEIAAKKKELTSRQGDKEFENEVKLIAKLQHRNLTKLLGYCIQGKEEILVYEFMANNSLDKVLFDPETKGTVMWQMRYNIIKGIAKGLVYMHHDSRLTIIHRDLKASNVLLDNDMTPKISDFGLARVFEDDVAERTLHAVGTRGYMSPEYFMHGHYSTKSDVYSFGILILEIVSGQRNWGYRHPVYDIGLVGYAWRIWNEGKAIELLDPTITESGDMDEVVQCILVGFMCCQRRAQDRPSMAQVISLLELNEISSLNWVPTEPYFCKELSESWTSHGSVNEAWRIWNEGKAIELLDPTIKESGDMGEVLQCILVRFLCCQRRAQDRPSMVQVISLLELNESSSLNCVPTEPYFCRELSESW